MGGVMVFFCSTSGFAAAKELSPQIGVAAMVVSIISVPIVSKFTK
ncbi:hypothetical protein [Aminipila terrae]|nr:hypothetical protein [Aminipila terrae]